jgi:predicted phage terminase large subunit-like protein
LSSQSASPASSAYSSAWVRSLPPKEQRALQRLTTPRVTKYMPHQPTIPQAAFLLLEQEEALYGGAAGGGKSDALLMAALQYADCPGYAAILFRRTFADLNQPGALIPRSMQWLLNTDARWNGAEHVWRFPSGAVLKFGHLDSTNAELEYQGAEFQFVGFDELTQFKQHQYEYLFSRLRRLEGSAIPIRMRAATNPGGPGHEWVKERFVKHGNARDRVFLTARLEDNPHLDRKQYERQLLKLDPVTRARLRDGDWEAKDSGGFFRREWFPLIDDAELPIDVRWVRFWDLAATEPHEGNKNPDWTAGVLMGRKTHAGRTTFYVRDVRRFRKGPGEVEEATAAVAVLDGREVEVRIEQEPGSSGKAVVGRYASDVMVGFAFYGEKSTGDKVTRAKPFSAASFNGLVRVVRGPWNEAYFDELESFPPPSGGHDDQVDASSGSFEALTGGCDWVPLVEESDVRTRDL